MKGQGKGWKGESRRHSLARKGVSTSFGCTKKADGKPKRLPIKNLQGKSANSIVIIGRRWFDKKWGNTYHSTEVYVDGEFIGRDDFEYGYGEQYIQTALTILQKAGLVKKTDIRLPSGIGKDYSDFLNDMRDNRSRYVNTVSDVERKKDL